MDSKDELTDDELTRYSRQLILSQIGEEGQLKLKAAKVLIIGAGGLGAPALNYLVAAGIGQITIIDYDTVSLSNLQRQILYDTDDIGRSKVIVAKEKMELLNPKCELIAINDRFSLENGNELVKNNDIILDCSDNFTSRYNINDICFSQKKPIIFAALMGFEGQLTMFKSYEKEGCCYRCLFPTPPKNSAISRCDTAGVLGSVAGIMAMMQVNETIKQILNIGNNAINKLILYDGLNIRFTTINTKKDKNCKLCNGSIM